MREFVMGDLHGSSRALKQCLKAVDFDYKKDRLVQLGDVVDGNPEVFECVEELLKIRNLIVVRGNHDDWFDEFCLTGRHPTKWAYGGIETARSYWNHLRGAKRVPINDYELTRILNPEHIPETHRAFFALLPLYRIDQQGRCFVHAGFDRSLPFTGQPSSNYYSDRDLWAAAVEWQCNKRAQIQKAPFQNKTTFKEIYIGHSPITYLDATIPVKCANITNLDTGAGQGGKLTIMDLRSNEYWQSDSINKFPATKNPELLSLPHPHV